MKKILFVLIVTLVSQTAYADKVCSKISKDRLGRIVTSYRTVDSSANCPRGFKLILDTATIISQAVTQAQLPSNLPSGQLMAGTWGGFFTPTANNQRFTDSETFPRTLGFVPIVEIITGATTANCPGSATNPDAAAGYLCLYEVTANNRANLNTFATETGLGDASTRGFIVAFEATAAGAFATSYGSYAVRAP